MESRARLIPSERQVRLTFAGDLFNVPPDRQALFGHPGQLLDRGVSSRLETRSGNDVPRSSS